EYLGQLLPSEPSGWLLNTTSGTHLPARKILVADSYGESWQRPGAARLRPRSRVRLGARAAEGDQGCPDFLAGGHPDPLTWDFFLARGLRTVLASARPGGGTRESLRGAGKSGRVAPAGCRGGAGAVPQRR